MIYDSFMIEHESRGSVEIRILLNPSFVRIRRSVFTGFAFACDPCFRVLSLQYEALS